MKYWKRKVMTLTREEIEHSVADPVWQEFRESLKGVPTAEKLDRLERYLKERGPLEPIDFDEITVQVDNYINALLRGGQLKRICNELLVVAK